MTRPTQDRPVTIRPAVPEHLPEIHRMQIALAMQRGGALLTPRGLERITRGHAVQESQFTGIAGRRFRRCRAGRQPDRAQCCAAQKPAPCDFSHVCISPKPAALCADYVKP